MMSEPKRNTTGAKTGRESKGQNTQAMFYGGLKSQNELYFQLASLYKEATKGSQSPSGQWIGRIMASQESNTSGKFF